MALHYLAVLRYVLTAVYQVAVLSLSTDRSVWWYQVAVLLEGSILMNLRLSVSSLRNRKVPTEDETMTMLIGYHPTRYDYAHRLARYAHTPRHTLSRYATPLWLCTYASLSDRKVPTKDGYHPTAITLR
eukprot:3941388-Rhodomonas_salina.2